MLNPSWLIIHAYRNKYLPRRVSKDLLRTQPLVVLPVNQLPLSPFELLDHLQEHGAEGVELVDRRLANGKEEGVCLHRSDLNGLQGRTRLQCKLRREEGMLARVPCPTSIK